MPAARGSESVSRPLPAPCATLPQRPCARIKTAPRSERGASPSISRTGMSFSLLHARRNLGCSSVSTNQFYLATRRFSRICSVSATHLARVNERPITFTMERLSSICLIMLITLDLSSKCCIIKGDRFSPGFRSACRTGRRWLIGYFLAIYPYLAVLISHRSSRQFLSWQGNTGSIACTRRS